MLTCRELIDFLDDYVAEALPGAARADFNEHLAICPPCKDYLRTYRDCIDLSKAALTDPNGPPPPEVPEELVCAILSALGKLGPPAPPPGGE
jgi:hypothetical protein